MADPRAILRKNLEASIAAKQALLAAADRIEVFAGAVQAVVRRYRDGGRLYVAGNGGSAADAQHLATEFVVRLARERPSLPAEALTVDSSTLTAIGNDYGFDKIFARQIDGKVGAKDVFVGITSSGQSANIVEALLACRRKGVTSILFCGRDGGPAAALADHCILAPGETTSTIQEVHIVLAHSLCECVENAMFGLP